MEYIGSDQQTHTSTWTVNLSIIERASGKTVEPSSLSDKFNENDLLPGAGGDTNPYMVTLTIDGQPVSDYEFTGWYTSAAAARDFDSNYLIESVTAPCSVFPGIRHIEPTYSVTFINTYPEAGHITNFDETDDGYDYDFDNDGNLVVSGIENGHDLLLPEIKTIAQTRSSNTNLPFIERLNSTDVDTEFFCYSNSPSLDIADLYFNPDRPTELENDVWIVYNPILGSFGSDTPQEKLTITSETDGLIIYMYFTSKVEVRTADCEYYESAYQQKTFSNYTQICAYQTDPRSASGPVDPLHPTRASVLWTAVSDTVNNLIYVPNGDTYQAWKMSVNTGIAPVRYIYNTVYWGKELYTPEFWCESGEELYDEDGYRGDLLKNYKVSSTSLVTPYSGRMCFAESGTVNSFPFNETGRSGHFIFTEQAVDWINLDMNHPDLNATCIKADPSDDFFPIGEHNPFVIKKDDDPAGIYRLAVSPADLYSDSADSYFGLTITPDEEDNPYYPGIYVYVPDDIVYPWGKVGNTRIANTTNPATVYTSANIGADNLASYAYVGVEGYKLVGFRTGGQYAINNEICGEREIDLILHQSGIGNSKITASPCTAGQSGTTVANRLSLNPMLYTNESVFRNLPEPITLTPVFVSTSEPVLSLEYIETLPGLNEGPVVSHTSKEFSDIKNHYYLSVKGLDYDWYINNSLDLCSITLNYVNGSASEGPTDSYFIDKGFYDLIRYDSYLEKWQICDPNSSPYYDVTAIQYDDSGSVPELKIPLGQLHVYNSGTSGGVTLSSLFFARGIGQEESSTALQYSEYKPTDKHITVADKEHYKYSCFIGYDRLKGEMMVNRVFKSTDKFSVATSAIGSDSMGNASAISLNNPAITGAIMDMAGLSGYGRNYYGGDVYAFFTGNSSPSTPYFGNDNPVSVTTPYSIDRTTEFGDDPSTILEYLVGTDYANGDYAGIFAIKCYNAVTISNYMSDDDADTAGIPAAYALPANVGVRGYIENNKIKTTSSSINGIYSDEDLTPSSYDYGYFNIKDHVSATVENTFRLDLMDGSQLNEIYDVPDGYILINGQTDVQTTGGGENAFIPIMVYIGDNTTESINYNGSDINIYEHKADVRFGFFN